MPRAAGRRGGRPGPALGRLATALIAAGALLGPARGAARDQTPRSSAAQAVSERIAAQWLLKTPGQIDRVELRATPLGNLLVVFELNGSVSMIEPHSGATLLDEPVRAEAGVRLARGFSDSAGRGTELTAAQASVTTLYLHDRTSVYAVAVSANPRGGGPTAQLKWSVGGPTRIPAEDQGDPEFLPRIVAAGGVDGGVLVLRNDGALALLDVTNGIAGRAAQIGATDIAELIPADGSAALLWYGDGAVLAGQVRVERGTPRLTRQRIADAWPAWLEPFGDGDVAMAWPNRFVVRAAGGDLTAFEPPENSPPLASALRITELSAGAEATTQPAAAEARRDFAFIYADPHGRILAVAASGGRATRAGPRGANTTNEEAVSSRLLWRWSPPPTCAGLRALSCFAGRAVSWNDNGVVVLSLATGAQVWAEQRPAPAIVSAHASADHLWMLRAVPGSEQGGELELRAVPIAAGEAAGSTGSAGFVLDTARDRPHQVLWLSGQLILVESDRVLAYKLPR